MNYYILRQDHRIPNQPTVMRCPDEIDPVDWIEGTVRPAPSSPLRLVMSERSGTFRGVIIEGLLTLFHQKFKDDLTSLGIDNIQYFPVELQNPEGGIEHKYHLINVLGLLRAVDASASVIEPMPTGGQGRLRSFKIDPAKAIGQRFFRLAEAPTLIIIDETLRDALMLRTPSGAIMLPTERYTGW
jgi:hypothetical protein